MILEFGTLRSECVLNASKGVSTSNGIGVLGGIPQFHTNSMVEKLVFDKRNIIYSVKPSS